MFVHFIKLAIFSVEFYMHLMTINYMINDSSNDCYHCIRDVYIYW
jgi:hypothetical protein